MTSFKLILEYDGSDFSGWQSQTNGRTVQDIVEGAIRQVTGEQVRIAGAGRTDAGVHATGQVASFALEKDISPSGLERSLNGVLPRDVVVRRVEAVSEDFHARFSARSRRYEYTIWRGPTALLRERAWSVGWELNTSYLTDCAEKCLGSHNFHSFSKSGSAAGDYICHVLHSAWQLDESRLVYTIQANRFLYGMVRSIVGTMVEIARSHRPIGDMERALSGQDRSLAGMAAPARGLCLVEITY